MVEPINESYAPSWYIIITATTTTFTFDVKPYYVLTISLTITHSLTLILSHLYLQFGAIHTWPHTKNLWLLSPTSMYIANDGKTEKQQQ